MVPASASALLAVPDRPLADRPETKGPDGSDGRFAGLMAQFVPARVPPSPSRTAAPQVAPTRAERPETTLRTDPTETQAPSASAAPKERIPPANPGTPSEEAPEGRPEIPLGSDTHPAPMLPEGTPLPLPAAPAWAQANMAPALVPAEVPEGTPLPLPAAPSEAQAMTAAAQPFSEPQPLQVGSASTDSPTQNASSKVRGSAGKAEIEAPSLMQAAATNPVNPLFPEGMQPSAPPTPSPAPALSPTLADPIHLSTPAVVQAVLAESPPPFKPRLEAQASGTPSVTLDPSAQRVEVLAGIPGSEGPGARASAPFDAPLSGVELPKAGPPMERVLGKLEATPLEDLPGAQKTWTFMETLAPSVAPDTNALKKPWSVTVPLPGPTLTQQGPAEGVEGLVQALAKPEPTPAKSDPAWIEPSSAIPDPASGVDHPMVKAAQPGPNSQPPLLTPGPDGSPLAALGALSRAGESIPAAPPSAPPSITPAAAPPPSAPMAQVEGSLRWMLKGGAQVAQLQLHPESLGQVTIHLRVEGGEVHARLWITEAASVQAVQEGRPHLELALREQGLQLGSFDLQQGHRPFRETPAPPSYREPTPPDTKSARQEAPAAAPLSVLNPHRVELYA